MPLSATQEGEAPGSRSRARRESPESRPTPALRRGSKQRTTAAMPTTRTRSGSQAPSERSERRRKRSAAVKERSEKGKTIKADRIREDEEEREAKKRNPGREEEEEETSSAPSSPLRQPNVPDELYEYGSSAHRELITAFERAKAKFEEKLVRQVKLITLEYSGRSPLFDDPQLLPVRESGIKAVLCAAKSVLGLSSSVGGKPLTRCSGFWIDWDEQNKTGIVLTTAHLIRTKRPRMNDWLRGAEYAPEAKVIVHLLDDTTAEGCLIYYQEHYDLAFFRVRVDQPVQLPSFNDGVKCAQEVFQLGRDESLNLRITHGRAEYLNPSVYERHHYMYFHREDEDNEYDEGGPVIDLDAKVVGMVNNCTRGSFIPSSILLKCLDLWKKFEFIPRPHLGLTFLAIKLVNPVHVEKIWRKFNIDDGLIVEEVSKGSHAEKVGIRRGDIIERFNGECISTTIELENMLLSICKGPFDRRNDINAEVHVSVDVFHTRKLRQRTRELTVNVSDRGEVVEGDAYLFTLGEGIPASVSPGQDGSASYPVTTREGISASVSPDQVGSENVRISLFSC